MPQDELNNLLRIGKLKLEPPARAELEGLLRSGSLRLADSRRATRWRTLPPLRNSATCRRRWPTPAITPAWSGSITWAGTRNPSSGFSGGPPSATVEPALYSAMKDSYDSSKSVKNPYLPKPKKEMTKAMASDAAKLPPIHPGVILKEEFPVPLGVTQDRLADRLSRA